MSRRKDTEACMAAGRRAWTEEDAVLSMYFCTAAAIDEKDCAQC